MNSLLLTDSQMEKIKKISNDKEITFLDVKHYVRVGTIGYKEISGISRHMLFEQNPPASSVTSVPSKGGTFLYTWKYILNIPIIIYFYFDMIMLLLNRGEIYDRKAW